MVILLGIALNPYISLGNIDNFLKSKKNSLLFLLLFYFYFFAMPWGIWDLVPWPRIELRPPALGAQNLSHWITREAPKVIVVQSLSCIQLLAIPWTLYSMPGFLVHHCLPELTQTHVHWVGDAIQPSHPLLSPVSSCPHSFPASGSFPTSQCFTSGGHSSRASPSVLSMSVQGWFPLGWTSLISLLSKGLSGVFSITILWKHQFF